MGGWEDGWIDGWMDTWKDGWMNGWIDILYLTSFVPDHAHAHDCKGTPTQT